MTVCVYALNRSSGYLAFLKSLAEVMEGAWPGKSIVLLGAFNAHVGNDRETWRRIIGSNGLPDPNLSGVLLLASVLAMDWP